MTADDRCECGCVRAAHMHYRAGMDCGSCGPDRCAAFHADRRAHRITAVQYDRHMNPTPVGHYVYRHTCACGWTSRFWTSRDGPSDESRRHIEETGSACRTS